MPGPHAFAATCRLITIPYSHFCEKARWALDRAEIGYREEGHLPIVSWWPVWRAGGRRTVPVLVTPNETLSDSTEILHYADRHGRAPALFPDGNDVRDLEDDFDRHVGPQSRRIAYDVLLNDRASLRRILDASGPPWEVAVGRAARSLIAGVIRKGLRVDPVNVRRSEATLGEAFRRVDDRLRDGRPYLVGARFSAADLTFAALAAPVVLPDEYARFLIPYPELPSAARAIIDRYRATAAGQFALQMYAKHRRPSPAVAAA